MTIQNIPKKICDTCGGEILGGCKWIMFGEKDFCSGECFNEFCKKQEREDLK